jgi:putative tryptophan/tyrosine transport system substrate-binding protein
MSEAKAMSRKTLICLLATVLLTTVVAAEAQQPTKIHRIGYLAARSSPEPRDEGFRQGLRDLGYIEGKNIAVEYRYARGKIEDLAGFVAEMVRLNVDVIVATGTPAAQRAKQATGAIPIVIAIGDDPVEMKLVDSLAHPGGNVTGVTTLATELRGKMLELLKEIVPRLTRVAVLWSPVDPRFVLNFKESETEARSLGLQLQSLEVRAPDELESAFRAATKERAEALIMLRAPVINAHLKPIADLAIKNRIPAIHDDSVFVENGGLISYGTDFPHLYRRAAHYVDRILKGTKPANLPVEQPTRFELTVNLKTAKQIGLTIPQRVLTRADKVIR